MSLAKWLAKTGGKAVSVGKEAAGKMGALHRAAKEANGYGYGMNLGLTAGALPILAEAALEDQDDLGHKLHRVGDSAEGGVKALLEKLGLG